MAVMLPDRMLKVEVRSHPFVRDARGVPAPSDNDDLDVRGPWPGGAQENPDLTWALRVDARAWVVRAGDRILDDQGNVWLVNGMPKLHKVPGVPDVDYIEVQATLEPPKIP